MNTCPLCKKDGFAEFLLYYMFRDKRFATRKCTSCSFVYVHPRPNKEELSWMYEDEYFLHDGADFGAHSATDYETAALKGSVKFPEILMVIQKFKPSGDFFEVGCGMGYFLDYVRRAGYKASGIEFSALGARMCRDKFGLEVQCTSLEDFPSQPERYDVIFMGDVLEHLIDPLGAVEQSRTRLRAGGVLALEVPSQFNSISGRLAARLYPMARIKKRMPMPPYHVNEFTPRTLSSILERAGFKQPGIIQRIKPPDTIALRGNIIENIAKKSLQYPNYWITKSLGILGDRLLGIGIKN